MAYGNPLDATTPAGGANANQLDDRIREAKAALIERLLTIVTDVNAQPLVLKPGIIPTAAIADDAITNVKMANDSVNTAEIVNLAVTAAKIALLAVDSAQIADNAITQLKMADNSVGTAEIKDGEVTNTKLATNAVTQVKMADDSVGTAEIIDANVTAAKLANNAVTVNKIAADSVNTSKIAPVERGLLCVMASGTRVLTQAETALASGEYREHDVDVTGAIVGRPCFVSWVAIAPGVYPTTTVGSVGPAGWVPGDEMRLAAWCFAVGKVKVRFKNLSAGALDMGAGGASLTVYQVRFLSD